jgi:hypothetical protein
MSGASTTHKTISIRDLRAHLDYAKSRLNHEKIDILSIFPLPDNFSREEYAFAYVRAERRGMRAINRKLEDIAWLPMQLDPSSEVLGDGRSAMKRWLAAATAPQPDSAIFGNDFMHALTRAGMGHGWDDTHFSKLSMRVATLFRDLSCLIGIVYYCTWLSEHDVDAIPLSNPNSLVRTAEEIATFLQSPALYEKLRVHNAKDKANQNTDAPAATKATTHQNGATLRKTGKPALHIVKNHAILTSAFEPEPAPAL